MGVKKKKLDTTVCCSLQVFVFLFPFFLCVCFVFVFLGGYLFCFLLSFFVGVLGFVF